MYGSGVRLFLEMGAFVITNLATKETFLCIFLKEACNWLPHIQYIQSTAAECISWFNI